MREEEEEGAPPGAGVGSQEGPRWTGSFSTTGPKQQREVPGRPGRQRERRLKPAPAFFPARQSWAHAELSLRSQASSSLHRRLLAATGTQAVGREREGEEI